MAGDKNKLTEKQRQILEYLKQEILQRGFPPSVREICEAVSLRSTSSVHAHLETLERKGYIKRDATKPRAIEICDEGFHTGRLGAIQGIASEDTASQSEVAQIPLIGKVAAGEPILAVENIEGYFPMPVDRLPNAETFLLKVQGESMVNAGILQADFLFVFSQHFLFSSFIFQDKNLNTPITFPTICRSFTRIGSISSFSGCRRK